MKWVLITPETLIQPRAISSTHQRVGQQRLAETAVLLGDHQPEDAELLEPSTISVRVLVRVLELGRDREDLLVHELADGLEDLVLDVGETLGLAEATHGGVLPSVGGRRARVLTARITDCPADVASMAHAHSVAHGREHAAHPGPRRRVSSRDRRRRASSSRGAGAAWRRSRTSRSMVATSSTATSATSASVTESGVPALRQLVGHAAGRRGRRPRRTPAARDVVDRPRPRGPGSVVDPVRPTGQNRSPSRGTSSLVGEEGADPGAPVDRRW